MKNHNKIFLILLLTLFISGANKSAPRKNVLFIIVDDLRPEIGCYGSKMVKSPHMDKLAGEGILFSRSYCQVPICGASRASLMSGLRPTTTRFRVWNSRVDVDVPGQVTLPQLFKQNNYYTLSNGKVFHESQDSEEESWSEPAWLAPLSHKAFLDDSTINYIGGKENNQRGPWFEAADIDDFQYTDGQIAMKTINDLKRMKKENKTFFIACGFYRPHLPFYVPKKYWDLYDRDSISIAKNRYLPEGIPSSLRASPDFNLYHTGNIEYNSDEFHRTARHGYYACVSYIDQLVGYLLQTLKDLKLDDETIVLLIGDHGWHLGEHNLWSKHNLFHNALLSPMILKVPGEPSGLKISHITEFVDIFPSLIDFTNLDVSDNVLMSLQGNSIKPLLNNKDTQWKKTAFSRFENGETLITEKYTYTEYVKNNGEMERMIYNLEEDPEENINLLAKPGNENLMIRLDHLLHSGWKNSFNADKY
ncbi:MAG: sulfatase [Prolixibacteraceae bacterium]|jgi:arylsulfatase A-like enzyme|nr:sulfatase [Prolixibacteraceae bacterium]